MLKHFESSRPAAWRSVLERLNVSKGEEDERRKKELDSECIEEMDRCLCFAPICISVVNGIGIEYMLMCMFDFSFGYLVFLLVCE